MHENDKYPGVPERIQLMDENGAVHEHPTYSRYIEDVNADTLREAYRLMYTTRRFDDEATALQRQGQLALWVPSRGQEAAQVGSALAYAPNDYIFPSYREHAVALTRGVDCPEDTQKPAVAVYFGDGSSTEGDAHESMVFAASYNAPVLFFVQNNRWAISVPFEVQSRVPVSTRAAGYGFEGIRVDGNDVLAVLAATRYAMEKIRAGEGPVLIEAETYRLGPHTTADDPTKYRTDADLEGPLRRDPMLRLEKHLREQGYADDAFFEEVAESAQQVANGVREAVLNSEVADFEYFFDRVYVQEHQQVEDDREFYRNYVAGFEEE